MTTKTRERIVTNVFEDMKVRAESKPQTKSMNLTPLVAAALAGIAAYTVLSSNEEVEPVNTDEPTPEELLKDTINKLIEEQGFWDDSTLVGLSDNSIQAMMFHEKDGRWYTSKLICNPSYSEETIRSWLAVCKQNVIDDMAHDKLYSGTSRPSEDLSSIKKKWLEGKASLEQIVGSPLKACNFNDKQSYYALSTEQRIKLWHWECAAYNGNVPEGSTYYGFDLIPYDGDDVPVSVAWEAKRTLARALVINTDDIEVQGRNLYLQPNMIGNVYSVWSVSHIPEDNLLLPASDDENTISTRYDFQILRRA